MSVETELRIRSRLHIEESSRLSKGSSGLPNEAELCRASLDHYNEGLRLRKEADRVARENGPNGAKIREKRLREEAIASSINWNGGAFGLR